jgi:hydrogenase maturation factor
VIIAGLDRFGTALVRTAAGEEHVDTTVVGTVSAGDLLLVHAGSAIARLGESA